MDNAISSDVLEAFLDDLRPRWAKLSEAVDAAEAEGLAKSVRVMRKLAREADAHLVVAGHDPASCPWASLATDDDLPAIWQVAAMTMAVVEAYGEDHQQEIARLRLLAGVSAAWIDNAAWEMTSR